ncbi:hypothetical protein P4626_05840, partial [Halalkalibacterium halodurans]|nr:hypothetical protein [Halalkalibacterium halodurans]
DRPLCIPRQIADHPTIRPCHSPHVQAATPAGKATAEDRREWGSRGSWSVVRGKRPPSRHFERISKGAKKQTPHHGMSVIKQAISSSQLAPSNAK